MISEWVFNQSVYSVNRVKTDGFAFSQSLFPNDTNPTCSPFTVIGPPESPPQLPTVPLPEIQKQFDNEKEQKMLTWNTQNSGLNYFGIICVDCFTVVIANYISRKVSQFGCNTLLFIWSFSPASSNSWKAHNELVHLKYWNRNGMIIQYIEL